MKEQDKCRSLEYETDKFKIAGRQDLLSVDRLPGGRMPPDPDEGGSISNPHGAERSAIRCWEPPKFTAAVVPANGIFWGGRGLAAFSSIADTEPCSVAAVWSAGRRGGPDGHAT